MNQNTENTSEAENLVRNLFPSLSLAESEQEIPDPLVNSNPERIDRLINQCGLPSRHSKSFPREGKEWLATETRLKAKIGSGFIIALCGGRGVGKTQLAESLARESASQNRSSRYITAMEFFLEIKASFRPDSTVTEKQVIEEFIRPKLLIIDETQERGETKWEDGLLTHLIDRRYRQERDTLLISNQTKEAFAESIGPSIASRIIETGGIVLCNWPSFRK